MAKLHSELVAMFPVSRPHLGLGDFEQVKAYQVVRVSYSGSRPHQPLDERLVPIVEQSDDFGLEALEEDLSAGAITRPCHGQWRRQISGEICNLWARQNVERQRQPVE